MAEVFTKSISDYFPMQQDMNFPKLFLHTITIVDYQLVTRLICRSCDKIELSVTNSVTEMKLRIALTVTRTSISRVEGKKTALSQSSEMCREKEIFSPSKTSLLYLEIFQVNTLFPAFISLSILGSVDRCLEGSLKTMKH